MASQTMTQTVASPLAVLTAVARPVLQRKCACGQHSATGECEECKKNKSEEKTSRDPLLQRSAVNCNPPNQIPAIVHEVLRSSGQPLDRATRTYFEPRFGQDFSQVRVHVDAGAVASARAINAFAYTAGQHVVFGQSQYAPGTVEGKRLLAHELTHTVQQSRSGLLDIGRLQPAGFDSASDPLEREADGIASELTSANSLTVRVQSHAPTIHRLAIPTGITLKESKPFGHADLKEERDKERILTCIGAVTLLQLTPPGDYTPGLKNGDCTKEHLTPVSSTCPEHDFCKDQADQSSKRPHEKCLEVGGSGSTGDPLTRTSVNQGPGVFVDRHVTRFPTSFLGDKDKKTCSVVCHQRYAYRTGSDKKEHDLGSFYIIRNFRKEKYKSPESKQDLTITTGEIKKVPADLAAPSKEKFAKDIAPGLVKSGSLLDAPPVPEGKKP